MVNPVFSRWLAALVLCGVLLPGSARALNPPAPTTPVVLITGSDRGIGLALARRFADRGWQVIATCRNPEHAADLKALSANHPNVVVETLDVISKPSIDTLAAKYRGRPIDVLINNAGISGDYQGQLPGHFDAAVFEDVMRVNAFAPLQVSSAFLDNVSGSQQKKIVTISSARGSITRVYLDHRSYFYDMSKSAVNMGMRKLQDDVSSRGVLIGIFTPGPVDTDLNRQTRNDAPPPAPLIKPEESAAALIVLIDNLSPATAGHFYNYKGEVLPW
jgi:NAD(P)-dependent dehydrogenase (short-subunit alcohol dehydrogenase family)